MLEMKLAGIALDAATRSPIVLLRDSTDRRQLPIFIGQDQARAIINALENQVPPRPLTHDLMVNVLEEWDMELERVVIHSLHDNTFYAILTVRQGGKTREIDARPSDSIALAVQQEAPIYVAQHVWDGVEDMSIVLKKMEEGSPEDHPDLPGM